ncbi:MAG: TetR/AcrR family transcriptional regulator [Dehalococcoidia bacterium]|nr:TetR/AcrR family transcriptional regulator [Dehalococcoidia bacterium]
MPKLKPEELETRRREIIEAARACFLRNGFHQTTTDEICREASITPGGLYHYFGSKEEIISAVIQQSTNNTVERLRLMIEDSGDVHSAFREVSSFFFATMRDPDLDNITRLDIEIWAETLKNEKLAQINRASWALRRRWLESLIRRGMEEGVYNAESVDPKGLASLLLAIFIGLRVEGLLWREDFDVAGALRSLFLMHAGRLTAQMPVELTGQASPAA